jgi:hypothetical protein
LPQHRLAIAVSATSDFTSMSHSARCCVARADPSDALARASAAVAGAVKPARALRSARRAVSARDRASLPATASCCSLVRRLT